MTASDQVRLRCVECQRELRTSAKRAIEAMRRHYAEQHPDSERRENAGGYGWTWAEA